MTVKERLHQIVERLPEGLPEAAIEATESALQPYRATGSANGARSVPPAPESLEERRARVERIRGIARHSRFRVEDVHRQRREEIEIEEQRHVYRASHRQDAAPAKDRPSE